MNKKNLLHLIFFLLPLLQVKADEPSSRSLLHAFEPHPDSNTAHVKSSTDNQTESQPTSYEEGTLPPPPPVNTQALKPFPKPSFSPAEPKPNNAPEKAITQTSAEKKEFSKQLQNEHDKDQLIRFYFENASLDNLVHYIEELFSVKFFMDDDITPTPQGGAVLKGSKISFKTNKPLSRTDAWSLFLKFLDIAGLSVVESQIQGFYRITTIEKANKEVLPTFFNTDINKLPNNNIKIRYVFFVKNTSIQTIFTIVQQLASPGSSSTTLPEMNAIVIADTGVSIRSLMKVIQELDKDMPEAMSVLKLKSADAKDVAQFYQDLIKGENPSSARFINQRVQPDSIIFPANVRMIVEPRLNYLFLLGPKESVIKIEEFIKKNVDIELDIPYSPLHTYEVQFLNADNLATILKSAIAFQQGSTVSQYGGVRDGDQFFGSISITTEPTGNRLIIKAEDRDYLKLIKIIKQLDVLQPQIAIEIMIVDIEIEDGKSLGSQIHNKIPGQPIKNVNFQTSGLDGTTQIVNGANGSLLGNLLTLVTGGTTPSGATVLSVGSASTGVWAIFQILKTYTKATLISNPFLLATNNYNAQIIVGSTRRVQTGNIQTTQGSQPNYGSLAANLQISIIPQIGLDNNVQMSINLQISNFSDPNNQSNGNTISKQIITSVCVKNKEIVVLGGMVKNNVVEILSKVPILGDIPLLGWFFKNKELTIIQSNIIALISPQIITSKSENLLGYYALNKSKEAKNFLNEMDSQSSQKDIINRNFFGEDSSQSLDSFLAMDTRLSVLQEKEKGLKALLDTEKNRDFSEYSPSQSTRKGRLNRDTPDEPQKVALSQEKTKKFASVKQEINTPDNSSPSLPPRKGRFTRNEVT